MLVKILKEAASGSGGTWQVGWEVKDHRDHDAQGRMLFATAIFDSPKCANPSTTAVFGATAQRGSIAAGGGSAAAIVETDDEAKWYGTITGTGTVYVAVTSTYAGPLVEECEIIQVKLS